MSARLQSVLQDLKDSCGATVADLTPQELEDLVFACARVESPYSSIHADLMEQPIYVSPGVYFWPLTAGAAVWLSEYAEQWWARSSAMFRWAQVYALKNARNVDAFINLTSKSKARTAILRCALSLACHGRELTVAISRAYGVEPHSAPTPRRDSPATSRAKTDFAALVARLEVSSGIPAKTWLWGKSIASMMKSYVELSELSVAAFGADKRDASIELDEAVENLARICAAIGERLNHERQQGN